MQRSNEGLLLAQEDNRHLLYTASSKEACWLASSQVGLRLIASAPKAVVGVVDQNILRAAFGVDFSQSRSISVRNSMRKTYRDDFDDMSKNGGVRPKHELIGIAALHPFIIDFAVVSAQTGVESSLLTKYFNGTLTGAAAIDIEGRIAAFIQHFYTGLLDRMLVGEYYAQLGGAGPVPDASIDLFRLYIAVLRHGGYYTLPFEAVYNELGRTVGSSPLYLRAIYRALLLEYEILHVGPPKFGSPASLEGTVRSSQQFAPAPRVALSQRQPPVRTVEGGQLVGSVDISQRPVVNIAWENQDGHAPQMAPQSSLIAVRSQAHVDRQLPPNPHAALSTVSDVRSPGSIVQIQQNQIQQLQRLVSDSGYRMDPGIQSNARLDTHPGADKLLLQQASEPQQPESKRQKVTMNSSQQAMGQQPQSHDPRHQSGSQVPQQRSQAPQQLAQAEQQLASVSQHQVPVSVENPRASPQLTLVAQPPDPARQQQSPAPYNSQQGNQVQQVQEVQVLHQLLHQPARSQSDQGTLSPLQNASAPAGPGNQPSAERAGIIVETNPLKQPVQERRTTTEHMLQVASQKQHEMLQQPALATQGSFPNLQQSNSNIPSRSQPLRSETPLQASLASSHRHPENGALVPAMSPSAAMVSPPSADVGFQPAASAGDSEKFEQRSGVPLQQSGAPQQQSGVPRQQSGAPQQQSGVPHPPPHPSLPMDFAATAKKVGLEALLANISPSAQTLVPAPPSLPSRRKVGRPPLARPKLDAKQLKPQIGQQQGQLLNDPRVAVTGLPNPGPDVSPAPTPIVDQAQPQDQPQPSSSPSDEPVDTRSPLTIALEGDLARVASLLNGGFHVDERDEDGNTLLHAASQNGCLLVVEHLLAREATIDVTNKRGVTPICIAMAYGHARVVDLLLECGADISIVTEQGLSPLYFAVGRDRTNVVKVAIDAGLSANCLVKPVERLSALHLAAARGNMDLIELLLDRGADVDAVDDWGRCSLHFAAYAGHSMAVLNLLKRKCDPTARTKRGTTASQIAKMKGYSALGALLANVESIFSGSQE